MIISSSGIFYIINKGAKEINKNQKCLISLQKIIRIILKLMR